MLGKNFEKVLQKNEIIDAVGLNLEDIRKFDKKRGKKTRPIKK